MTMSMPGRITPTEDQRREEEDKKRKQERFKKLSTLLSSAGGHSIRPTIGNMIVIFNNYEEWKGVLGLDESGTLVMKSPPPFTADYDIEGKRNYPAEFTEFDIDRTMIWFEREAKVLIETEQGRILLRRALWIAAKPR